LISVAAAVPTAAAATPSEAHVAQVDRALYDLCPRLLRGELVPGDALVPLGYRPISPIGKLPRWQRGEGDETVIVGSNDALCMVAFGGRDNKALFEHASRTSGQHGFIEQPLDDPKLRSGVRNYRRVTEGSSPWLLSFLRISEMEGVSLKPLTFAAYTIAEHE
jgi:hypothetical protein